MVGCNILEHPSAHKHDFFAPTRQELNLLDRDAVRASMAQVKLLGLSDLIPVVIHHTSSQGGTHTNARIQQ